MKIMLAVSCLAVPIALGLTSTTSSAQYYTPPAAYQYYAPPAAYQYYAPPAPYKYYTPPVAYYGPFILYYRRDPVRRFWSRQERFGK
jgi:hypothetical protein